MREKAHVHSDKRKQGAHGRVICQCCLLDRGGLYSLLRKKEEKGNKKIVINLGDLNTHGMDQVMCIAKRMDITSAGNYLPKRVCAEFSSTQLRYSSLRPVESLHYLNEWCLSQALRYLIGHMSNELLHGTGGRKHTPRLFHSQYGLVVTLWYYFFCSIGQSMLRLNEILHVGFDCAPKPDSVYSFWGTLANEVPHVHVKLC